MEKVGKAKSVAKKILGNGFPVLFLGDRGIGKTSIAWEIAKEMGLDVFYLNVSQMFPENISFPQVREEILHFITFDLNNKIVILDELTNRNPDMHSLLQSLVLDKRIGDKKFENIYFIATGNKPEQSSVATIIPRPLVERFVVIDFPIPSKEEWASYTMAKGGNPLFVSFILNSPDHMFYEEPKDDDLNQYPSPRNNTRTAILLKDLINNEMVGNEDYVMSIDSELDIIISGSSGKKVYLAFKNYIIQGRYYSYKNYAKGDYPRNDSEVLSLIVDIADLVKRGMLDLNKFNEIFEYVHKNHRKYDHYMLSYTALVNGNEWKADVYEYAHTHKNSALSKYLKEISKKGV